MTPYFETSKGKLFHGDCLEVDLINEKAALICIDPPYNIGKDSWDKIADYDAWMGEVFKLCERSLADNGSFYWFHNKMPVIARLMERLRLDTEFVFKQLITWNKYFKEASNVGFCKQRLSNDQNRNFYGGFTEYCLFYTFQDETGLSKIMDSCVDPIREYLRREVLRVKGRIVFKEINQVLGTADNGGGVASAYLSDKKEVPAMITEEHYLKLKKWLNNENGDYLRKEYEDLRKEYEDLRQEYESLRYTFNNQPVTGDFRFHLQDWNNSVWNYSAAPQIGHLTPKPIRLISNILKHSSNPGDLVVDFFGGSGTTGEACETLNRRWILCEMEEKYCEIAAKRIEAAASQKSFEDYL